MKTKICITLLMICMADYALAYDHHDNHHDDHHDDHHYDRHDDHHDGIGWGGVALGLGLGLGVIGGAMLAPNYNNYGYGYPSQQIYIQPQPTYIQPPPVYIQQPQQQYWYFCGSVNGYYPYVKVCPEGWQEVIPY